MDLARAFTTRKPKQPNLSRPIAMGRAASTRQGNAAPPPRNKISSPVELLSTTNMLSYNAPNIAGTARVRHVSSSTTSSASSAHSPSSEDSDHMPSLKEDNLTDASSVDSNPPSPEPNHLSCYFKASFPEKTPGPNAFARGAHSKSASIETVSPAIPQRAPSHSKRAHVDLARKRSLQQMAQGNNSSPILSSRGSGSGFGNAFRSSQSREPVSRPTSSDQKAQNVVKRSASIASIRGDEAAIAVTQSDATKHSRASSRSKREAQAFDPSALVGVGTNPFGKEIEQLQSVAEEFTGAVRDAAAEEDLKVMRRVGLVRFDATDYLAEIGLCYAMGGWDEETARGDATVEVGWI